MDVKRLKAKIVLAGMNACTVAEMTGMGKSSLYRKLRGETDFKRCEIQQLCALLNITPEEKDEIFFCD